jgi:hypothetical protein
MKLSPSRNLSKILTMQNGYALVKLLKTYVPEVTSDVLITSKLVPRGHAIAEQERAPFRRK